MNWHWCKHLATARDARLRLSFLVLTYALRHHIALISTSGNTIHAGCETLNNTDKSIESLVLCVTSQLCITAELRNRCQRLFIACDHH